MKSFVNQIQFARKQLLSGAKKVGAYFTSGGGETTDSAEPPQKAWTSEEQKKRAAEFRQIAEQLRNDNRAA